QCRRLISTKELQRELPCSASTILRVKYYRAQREEKALPKPFNCATEILQLCYGNAYNAYNEKKLTGLLSYDTYEGTDVRRRCMRRSNLKPKGNHRSLQTAYRNRFR